jgi:hypothetical protein
MFHLLPLLATVLTPLLLAAHAAPTAHDENPIAHAEQRAAEDAARAVEHGEAGLARDVALGIRRHEEHAVRKRAARPASSPDFVEVVVKRDPVAVAAAGQTNVRLAREKRWGGNGGGGGGWGQRGGCCAGCPGSRGW